MEYHIPTFFGFFMSIAVIAIGVRLGIGPLVRYKESWYTKESLLAGLRAAGVLSQEEFHAINSEYPRRRRAADDKENLKETLQELTELGFFTQAQLVEKQGLLDEYCEHNIKPGK